MNQSNTDQSNTSAYSNQTNMIDGARVAFIQAGWHGDILDIGREAFLETASSLGLPKASVDRFDVPGAYEIPLQAKAIAETGRYEAIVATALVVDGGIYRHDFVARAVIDGMMRVQLDTSVPVLSVVLTPHHFHEHEDHRQFFLDHFKIKGAEAAHACVATIANHRGMIDRAAA